MTHLAHDVHDEGLWLDGEFLWDVMPRLSPLAVYVYLAIGKHVSPKTYPTVDGLVAETLKGQKAVRLALAELARTGLLSDNDLKHVLRTDTP